MRGTLFLQRHQLELRLLLQPLVDVFCDYGNSWLRRLLPKDAPRSFHWRGRLPHRHGQCLPLCSLPLAVHRIQPQGTEGKPLSPAIIILL